ncbi:hypothetical protein [Pseudomonas haemolytica]|uniref:RES domain-containing protein n=1 Tax=Pseudomonas haemolytica TaxID=2600065 RepID=A0ABS1GPE0_9PSED|nr:hypothetical protein [Pseudomonas haemolytica]MBK3458836.1 hypothetical protein [Pseudomonas haemolytica]
MKITTLHLGLLEELTTKILKSTDANFVRDKLNFILDHYQIINYEFNYNQAFWRARKCPTDAGFRNISELGSPPIALTPVGRLNEANDPILYTSVNQYSTFMEIDAEEGDFIHIAAFKQSPDKNIRCATIGELAHMHRWGSGLSSEMVGNLLNDYMGKMPHDVGKSVIFTDAFFTSLLRDKEAKKTGYLHSRTLSNLIFSRIPGLDAIIYSGVALESSRNYAFKPACVERTLSIEATFVLKILKKYKYGIYDFEVLKNAEGVESDGTLIW